MRWAAVGLILALHASAAIAQTKPGRWLEDLSAAQEQSRATGKPLMIVFRCVR